MDYFGQGRVHIKQTSNNLYEEKYSIRKNSRCGGKFFKSPLSKDRREGLEILLKTSVLGGGFDVDSIVCPTRGLCFPTRRFFSLQNLVTFLSQFFGKNMSKICDTVKFRTFVTWLTYINVHWKKKNACYKCAELYCVSVLLCIVLSYLILVSHKQVAFF